MEQTQLCAPLAITYLCIDTYVKISSMCINLHILKVALYKVFIDLKDKLFAMLTLQVSDSSFCYLGTA